MKKIIFIILLAVVGFGGAFVFTNDQGVPPSVHDANSEVKSVQVTPKEALQPEKPVRIEIPTLNVNVVVEHVGETETGAMDVPADWMNAAWYDRGARPGERGSAVVAAHYDTPSGGPSVFYDLATLSQGDIIRVTDEDGNTHIYGVTNVADYPTNDFPLEEVFGDHAESRLNLITCGGIFDTQADDYLSRTVVYSELIETIPAHIN